MSGANCDILEFFPKSKQPRPIQIDTLRKIEEVWKDSDVIVVNLPVATGKSYIAMTIAKWLASKDIHSRILTPTNILVDQYIKDFPRLHTVYKKSTYVCEPETPLSSEMSCEKAHKKRGRTCDNCPYVKAKKKGYKVPYGVYNYYTYYAHKYFEECMIVDEAHNLISTIQAMAADKIWCFQYGIPPSIKTYRGLLDWIERHPSLDDDAKLQKLHKELVSGQTSFLVQRTIDLYHKEYKECLKLLPVDIRNAPPFLWPIPEVSKLILLSATIGFKDVESLGLDKRKVTFIHADSPIPIERRPVHYTPIGSLSMHSQDNNLPLLAARIQELLQNHTEKGFIHITYSLANKLQPLLKNEERLIWHDKENKMAQYQSFRAKTPESGAVMVASGLYEGVDLPEDMGRWQVITKVPWPSLGEPAIKYLAERDPEWYSNECIKTILQASGRICRSISDYGITYILDSSFKRLYDNYRDLFPEWYQKGVIGL